MTTKQETIAREALGRARGGVALSNYPTILEGFTAKGIPEQEIRPRENIFTYHAWRALGRQVKAGEHGVRIHTWLEVEEKIDTQTGEVLRKAGRRPWRTTVFHLSQTTQIGTHPEEGTR